MISEVKPTTTTQQSTGVLMPLLIIGIGGVAVWKGFDYFGKERERKEIEKATQSKLKSEMDTIRTKEAIAKIESKAYVSGVNGYGKTKTVNIVNQAKELINLFLITLTDANGINKYILRSKPQANDAKIRTVIFETPLNNLRKLAVIYNIYTKRDLLQDCQKLSLNTNTEIKKLYEIAYKKYPATFK